MRVDDNRCLQLVRHGSGSHICILKAKVFGIVRHRRACHRSGGSVLLGTSLGQHSAGSETILYILSFNILRP